MSVYQNSLTKKNFKIRRNSLYSLLIAFSHRRILQNSDVYSHLYRLEEGAVFDSSPNGK